MRGVEGGGESGGIVQAERTEQMKHDRVCVCVRETVCADDV